MKWSKIIGFNILGLTVLLSWLWPKVSLWTTLDDKIFWFFNQYITTNYPHFVEFLALVNTRWFDIFSLLVMGLLFFLAMQTDQGRNRLARWVGVGITMLVVAGLLSIITHDLISFTRESPTRWYSDANLVSSLSAIATKDSAGNSFPGDHGLMLMVFTAFLWRFSFRWLTLLSALCVVLLSAPRLMIGAHWFSDIYMGSLSIALIGLPWILCTPLAKRLVDWFEMKLAWLPFKSLESS